MKYSTRVIVGIRNVGAAGENPVIESMTMVEAIKKIALYTAESTMAQRFQFTLARDECDAMVGLGLRQTLKDARLKSKADEIAGFLDNLFESSDAPAQDNMTPTPDEFHDVEQVQREFRPGLPTRTKGDN